MVSLMDELFVAIRLVSTCPVPIELPALHRLSKTEIQRRLCDGRPCSIKAFCHPDQGVFVDEALDVHDNAFDRSIFLHELVHHLQKATGKFEKVTSACSRRIAEGIEAYEIQNCYLSRAGRHVVPCSWDRRAVAPKTTRRSSRRPAFQSPIRRRAEQLH